MDSRSKQITLPEFLTENEISACMKLYEEYGMDAVSEIRAQVIEPNMAAIDAKLGQENDARYLAYAIVYVFSQSAVN